MSAPRVLDTPDLALASVVNSAIDIAHACAYDPESAAFAIASIEAFEARQTQPAAARVLAAIILAIRSEVQP